MRGGETSLFISWSLFILLTKDVDIHAAASGAKPKTVQLRREGLVIGKLWRTVPYEVVCPLWSAIGVYGLRAGC